MRYIPRSKKPSEGELAAKPPKENDANDGELAAKPPKKSNDGS